VGAGGGSGIQPPNLTGAPGSGRAGGLNGLGNVPPLIGANIPPLPGSIGSGSGSGKSGTGTGTGTGGLGSFSSPKTGAAPGGTSTGNGLGGLTGLGAAGVPNSLANNPLQPVNLPPGLANPPGTVSAGGAPPPMMPPGGMGGAGAGANSGSDRPDSAGLLGGIDKPWTGDMPDNLGDPNSLGHTPALQSASWAPPPSTGVAHIHGAGASTPLPSGSDVASPTGNPPPVGLPGGGVPPLGMPMMPPGGMGGGAGAGANSGSERPDSAGPLSEVSQPSAGGPPPASVSDPNVLAGTPPVNSASWTAPAGDAGTAGTANSNHIRGGGALGNQPPFLGTHTELASTGNPPPGGFPGGMPPGGAGDGTAGAARPDPAPLLSGVSGSSANGAAPDGVSDPNVLADAPPVTMASWAVLPAVSPAALPPAELSEVGGPAATSADPVPPAEIAAPAPARPRWGLADPVAGTSAPAAVAEPPVAGAGTPETLVHHKDRAVAPGLGASPEGAVSPEAVVGGHGAEPSPFPSQDHDSVLRVAVVRPTESAEDISAWDVGTAEFLPGLLPTSGWAANEVPEEQFVLDLVERSNEPWNRGDDYELEPMSAEMATYRRRKQGEGEFISDGEWPMCSGEDAPPESEVSDEDVDGEDDEEDGEEEEERSMADLLSQDDSAWGRAVSKPSGVLE
jgi:hypothetical protein